MNILMYRRSVALAILCTLAQVGILDARRSTQFADIFVPFPAAMEGHSYLNAVAACDAKSEWQLVKRLYTQYLVNDLDWSDMPRIPKVIHHIWLGSPLPEKCRVLRETWIQNHPDWEFILWTEKEIEEFGLENQEAFDKSENYGEKSDIARYEIIYRLGGLYVDTDYESIKPMDVLHHSLDFYTGIYTTNSRGNSTNMVMGMGLIGAIPGHPVLRAAIDGIKGTAAAKNSSSAILSRTGPYYFTKVVLANAGKNNLRDVIFPPQFVYPTPISGRGQSLEDQHKNFVTNSTFANHVWHMSWINNSKKSPAPKQNPPAQPRGKGPRKRG
jgi:inositol phosphorylceramide mannosyltransferase catalytic subunit